MITSLWLLGNYFGAFLSSVAGGLTFDLIGFSWSCTLLASIITVAVSDVYNMTIKSKPLQEAGFNGN